MGPLKITTFIVGLFIQRKKHSVNYAIERKKNRPIIFFKCNIVVRIWKQINGWLSVQMPMEESAMNHLLGFTDLVRVVTEQQPTNLDRRIGDGLTTDI